MRTATRWLLLAPMLLVLGGLFGGALVFALLVAVGAYPGFDLGAVSLASFSAAVMDASVLPSLAWTLYLAVAGTLLATVLGVLVAWTLLHVRSEGLHLLVRAPVLVPHVVASLMMLTLLAGTGLLSRLLAALGLLRSDQDFPILVHDPAGVGILLAYTWKEAPFMALVALTAMRSVDPALVDQAKNLGARGLRVLLHVHLPLIRPALAAGGILVLAFTFGSYEVPALLDRLSPGTLPVLAVNRFTNPADLATDWPRAMASALLLTSIGLALTLAYMRLVENTRRARWV